MTNTPAEVTGVRALRISLRRLERRELLLWWATLFALVLSAAAWLLLAVQPARARGGWLSAAVAFPVGFVLVFAFYAVYQQGQLKGLRFRLVRSLQRAVAVEVRTRSFDRLSVFDPLTGLHNRRFAELRLAAEIARARREGEPLLVLAFDLDDFLAIVEAHGREAGEELLKVFAGRLQQASRGYDLAVRSDGEGFLLVLPECRLGQAFRVINRMMPVEFEIHGERVPVSFSIGWAHYQPGETVEGFLERAARELAANKRDDAPRTIVSYLEGVASS